MPPPGNPGAFAKYCDEVDARASGSLGSSATALSNSARHFFAQPIREKSDARIAFCP